MLSKLWVRNVIGTIVAAAAVSVLVFTGLGGLRQQWLEYRHTLVPGTVVPAGQSGDADGQTWKIDTVKHLNRTPSSYGPALPAGTVLTVVTVDRSGTPPSEKLCKGVITDGQRRWNNESLTSFTAPDSDGVTSMCSHPGLLRYTFLLPDDVVPTAMDVVAFDGRIMVRMLL